MELVHPALIETLLGSKWIDLRRHADNTCYISRLRLGSGHSTETRSHEKKAMHILIITLYPSGFQLLPRSIHHSDRSAMNNSLRADIHIGTRRHLTILRNSEGIESLPIVL